MKIINTIQSKSQEETIKAGYEFAQKLNWGSTVIFNGDLGAGKTHFIKGICKFFSVEEEATSPTFTIINIYNGYFDRSEIEIAHIDLYRIEDPAEFRNIGFSEYLFDDSIIKLIEWPQRAETLLEGNVDFSVDIKLNNEIETAREIIISSYEYIFES